jgi:hypothetical protein
MRRTRTRGLAVLGTALLVAVALAACGGGGGSSTTSSTTSTTNAADTHGATNATGASASRTALVACLKKYGVTLPSSFGGGFGRFGATGASGRRFPTGATGASGRRFPFGGTGASGRHFPFGASGASGPRFGGGGFGGTGASGAFGDNSKLAAALAKCGGFTGGFGDFGASGRRGPAGVSTQVRTEITSFVTCMRKDGVSLPNPNFSGSGSVFGNVNQTTASFKAAYAKCQGILTYLHHRGQTGATGSTTT